MRGAWFANGLSMAFVSGLVTGCPEFIDGWFRSHVGFVDRPERKQPQGTQIYD